MRLNLPARLAKANMGTAGREIIVTNGLSVRQEQGCGWLFYHAKKNRLCLSSYSIQHDCVIRQVLAVFVFAELFLLLWCNTRKTDQKMCLFVFPPENRVTL